MCNTLASVSQPARSTRVERLDWDFLGLVAHLLAFVSCLPWAANPTEHHTKE